MESKELKITVPEGWEVDTANSDIRSGKIVLKQSRDKYPTDWKEVSQTVDDIYVIDIDGDPVRRKGCTLDVLPLDACDDESEAEALRDFLMLHRIYKAWTVGNTLMSGYTFEVAITGAVIVKGVSTGKKEAFVFPDGGIAQRFVNTFKGNILKASTYGYL